ncbi:MAG: hypothetical protein SF339_11855 [Blastocatellia bacterium]|nr:hypothetical protein [Blastocatellia bacterium]
MKRFGMTVIALSLFCMLTAGIALANNEKSRSKDVTFSENVMVNGTMVKAGVYRVKFDAKTSEVIISRDGNVVAKTKASVEVRESKAPYNSASFTETEKGKVLTGINFSGDRRAILIQADDATPAGGQQ